MNRLTRDEILMRALDLIDSSALDQKDRPFGSAIQQNAITLGFLQDGLDYFHRQFPWTGLIKKQSFTFNAGTQEYDIPSDFTLDVRDGIRIMNPGADKKRLKRKALHWLLNRDTTSDKIGIPTNYVIMGTKIKIYPIPDKTYSNGELWYYSMPDPLKADDVPLFPDDWTLVEYVRYRGREWTGEMTPGTAIDFCHSVVAKLQKAGLGIEGENDELELDASFFRPTGEEGPHTWDWMGSSIIR